jgi:eukaryotic-like serine/threonine-protein kinase
MGIQAASVRSIFLEAVEHYAPDQWAAYLDRACADDPALRTEVEILLRAHAEPDGPLDRLGRELGKTADDTVPAEAPDTVIGPYKLLEPIGEGGFGIVFMAEQQQPVRRKVALKVLKPGMDTRQVVARFEAERQALALMDHPSIARIFDGGATASGRPYFVMELVKGVAITAYCDRDQLTVRERLELFLDVCRAVQHAHQKGIIHRDLKPSNVLVTLHDGTPVVKVIDFGIAKALGPQPLTDKTLFTNFAQLIGTPLYMSPEQAALSGLDVDTRSDIYALGVLLYELLTGTTPFDQERLKTAAFDEFRRMIREEEPPKPSTRMSTLGPSATTVSANRRSDPKRLRQLLRGELDWIVMKCLEKDRNRRYETVNGLMLDLQRYLADEPVQACPPSAWYRFCKFTRRNKAGLTMAGLILSILVLLGGGAGWVVRDRAARRAMTEREVTQALDEATTLQGQSKWPEALEAAKRAEGFLAGGASESLRQRVREVLNDLKMVLRLEEIWLPRAQHGTEGAYDYRWADASYAEAFRDYGIDVEALEPAEAARRIRERTIRFELTAALDSWADKRQQNLQPGDVVWDGWPDQRDFNPATDDAGWKRLMAVARAVDPDEFRDQVRDALERRDREGLSKLVASPKTSDLPFQTFSVVCRHVENMHTILALQRAHLRHPDNFFINGSLARASRDADEAIRFYTAARAIRPRNAPTALFLGDALHRRGRLDEAIALYREAIALDPDLVYTYRALIETLQSQGKRDEAIAEIRAAVAAKPNNAPLSNSIAWISATCADARFRDPRLAVELASRAVALAPNQGDYWKTLGAAHYRAGNWDGAIAAFEKSMPLRNGGRSSDWFFLAMACWQLGRRDEARMWYDRAVQWMEKHDPKQSELCLFRAEAAALLGLPEPTAPARKEVLHPAKR